MKRSDIVNNAKNYINCKQGDALHKNLVNTFNGYSNEKVTNTSPWCAVFVSDMFIFANAKDKFPITAFCPNMITKAKAMDIWEESDSYSPSVGDVILYDWEDTGKGDNMGTPNHVGIVYTVSGSNFTVIEGNKGTSKAVGIRNMTVNGKYIRGYILPEYDESAKLSVSEVAKLVVNGKYGNGEARKKALEAEGYNYTEVQNEVNKLLSGNTKTETKLTNDEVADLVIKGKYGNGTARKKALEAEGYNYKEVMKIVNKKLKG